MEKTQNLLHFSIANFDLFAAVLLPWECEQPVNVKQYDHNRNEVLEYRPHPVLHLQAFAGIGFQDEIIPSPADLAAAEEAV